MTVPLVTRNPFQVPHCPAGIRQPLCPWQWPEHTNWYVDIDGFPAAMERFRSGLRDPSFTSNGHMFVVFGETGTGKTSLIHRCADEASQLRNAQLSADKRGDFIVDLSQYNVRSAESIARLQEVAGEILRVVRKKKVISSGKDWATSLENDYRDFYHRLAESMDNSSRTLIVILPALSDWIPDIKEYLWLSREMSPLIFFGETSDKEAARYVEEELPRTHYLQVNFLNSDDRKLLFDSRIAFCVKESVPVAAMTDAEFDDFNGLIGTKATVSVRMLARFLYVGWDGVSPTDQVRMVDIMRRVDDFVIAERPSGGGQA